MNRMKVAEFWLEVHGDGWRLLYESPSIKLFYCLEDLWTTKEIGAKIFRSQDAAMLAIASLSHK